MFDLQQIKGAAFEEALRQMPAAAFIAEAPSGKITFVNEQARHLIEQNPGWSMPSDLGNIVDFGDLKVFHPDGRPLEMEEWPLVRTIGSGEEVRDAEYSYLHADGTRLSILCSSSPIHDDEGRMVAGILIVHDITERKRAAEQLAYHASLLENIHDAAIAMNERFVITAWNKGAGQLYGWSADEALGRNVWEVVPIDAREETRAEGRRALAETGRFRTELTAYRKDGTPINTEVTIVALRDDQGDITGYLSIDRDVTERKQTQKSQARHAAILEATSDFVSTADPGERILYVNEAGRRMLGISDDEDVTNTTISDYHPEWAYRIVSEQGIPAAVRDGAWRGESALLSRVGREISISQSIVSHKGSGGEEEYLSTVARDITERKRFEMERQRLVDIVQNSSEFIGIADLDWRAVFLNEAGQRMVGLHGMEEVRQTRVLDYFMPEDRAYLRDTVANKVMEEGRWAGELNLRHFETGEPIPVLWDGFRVDDAHTGEPISIATVTRDITERKRAEERLAYHAHLLENMNDAVVATDGRFDITAWNKGAEEMYGWSAGEVLGRNLFEVIPPDLTEEQVDGALRELAEAGRLRAELVMYRKDGAPVYTEMITAVLRDEHGQKTGHLGIYRDISERRRAEREIEIRTRQQAVVADIGLRALANVELKSLMEGAVVLVTGTLGVEYCKIVDPFPGDEELLVRAGIGWREGIVGSTENVNLDPQSTYTLRSGEPVIVEDLGAESRFSPAPVLREHGVVSTVTVVIPGRERPFGVLGAYTRSPRIFSEDDVNFLQAVANVLATVVERKQADEELGQVREAERSRIARDLHDEALQDLAYAMTEGQLIQAASEDPRPRRLVAALKRVEQRLRGAIYDLRLEGEQDKPFSELLETLVQLHRTMLPEDCDVYLDAGDGVLAGPLGETGRQVLHIVGEALTNARRHSGAGNIRVAVWTSQEKLYAEISDDGRGFDPAELSSPGTASGMGIRGMRERSRTLGGELEVHSEPGSGVKVRLELSLDSYREQPEKEVRVLLVEDHATVREAIASAFEREAGFEVVGQAGSLAEARQMLEAEPVDVAVVDLGLPDGYGADLVRDLQEANPQAQALVLSASLDRARIARAIESGAAGILHKTVHLDEVVDAVRRLRAGQTLVPLEEVVELLRFAGSKREEEYEARRAIASLTPREREVLRALAAGLDSKGIAEQLHISLRTERNHMASILAKLGVHSQLQALVFALRHGVVEVQ